VRFKLGNGAEGVIQQTAGAWGPPASLTRIAGARGTLWTENGTVHLANSEGVRQLTLPLDLELPAIPSANDDPRHRYSHLELGPYIRLCEVLRAGTEDRPFTSAVPPPTFEDGLACMKVLDAIRESAGKNGALIELS
jgi:predicted dehydrogenase